MGCIKDFCATEEVAEEWNVEFEFLEEGHFDAVERGINSGHDVLQVPAIAGDGKVGESGEDYAWERRGTLTCSVGPKLRGFDMMELKVKRFQPCQSGKDGDHRLG